MDDGWTLNTQPPRPRWGVHAPTQKAIATRDPIVVVPPPAVAVIPLVHRGTLAFSPLVRPGDTVRTGQPVAQGLQGEQVHASVTGTVREVSRRIVANPHLAECDCLVIDRTGTELFFDGYPPAADPLALSPDAIRAGIASAGIVGLGGALFPTARKLMPPERVRALIINGAECEPWITCDEMLLRERAREVIAGARIMMHALGTSTGIIAVETDMPEARVAVHDALAAAGNCGIQMAVVTAKYPAGGERQLIELLTGIEVPTEGHPGDAGFICQNAATTAAVADLFFRGRPLISRVVTVTGKGIANPGNHEVRLGAPISDLIELAGGYQGSPQRLIMGGPMMGLALPGDDLPVTKATNCIAAVTAGEFAVPRMEMPCIRCGECIHVCPANLLPQELLIAARTGDAERLDELGLLDCIECGCCDYVCPSYIKLTARFVSAKNLVHDRRAARRSADIAKERFEKHERRLAGEQELRSRGHEEQDDAAAIHELVTKLRNNAPPH